MRIQSRNLISGASSVLVFLLLAIAVAAQLAQSAERARGRQASAGSGAFRSPCGTAEQVSKRIGLCMVNIFDLIKGNFPEPKSDQDIQGHCVKFSESEKCIRQIAKDCLTGLHKTSTSAVPSAMKRFRTQECRSVESRARYIEPLKCAIKNGPVMQKVYYNHTGITQTIRDLSAATPEEKLMKTCCMLNSFDAEIAKVFDSTCPKATPIVLGMVHAISDDARSTLCVAPKCKGALDKVVAATKYTPPQSYIEPIMQVLFMLSTE